MLLLTVGALALAATASAQSSPPHHPTGTQTAVTAPAGTVTALHVFRGTDADHVSSALILGSDGFFYGVADLGGDDRSDDGTVFKVSPAGAVTVLHGFVASVDGQSPIGLVEGRNGVFYGTTRYGGSDGQSSTPFQGTLYQITSDGVLTTLHGFTLAEGGMPRAPLLLGSDGFFYGTTTSGPSEAGGIIFKAGEDGVPSVLHQFLKADGYGPEEGPREPLLEGSDGNFYGTTPAGGANGEGAIFKMTPAGVFSTLHALTANEGSEATLIQGSDGNFYGTTSEAGAAGVGTFFKLTPGGVFTILHIFDSFECLRPVEGSDGNFYGVTVFGGNNNIGSIYRISPGGDFVTLYHFASSGTDAANGFRPNTPLIQSSDGFFYGMTTLGATYRAGVIYRATLLGPAITSATKLTTIYGQPFQYQITATNHPTSFKASGLPAGLRVDTTTGLITGMPTVSRAFNVVLQALGTSGTAQATLALLIKPPPVVITSDLNPPIQAGVPFHYQITATENPTNYSTFPLPEGLGLSKSTGRISGTPTMAGTRYVELEAFSSMTSGSAVLKLVVKDPVLTITSDLHPPIRQGTPFRYQITATGNPTSYHTRGLPAGLGLSTTKGVISGTPSKAGTYKVAMSVADSEGAGAATLDLVVKGPMPVITSAGAAAGRVGAAFTYQITASGNPTSYAATGLPAGLSVNKTTGQIKGTPSKAGTYSASIMATNQDSTGVAPLTLTIQPAP